MLSVSILGLYQFNPRVFDLLTLPEGVDRDTLLHNLLAECSDFCLLYPDWDFMRAMIGVWSTNEGKIWKAMQQSVTVEYNPIENYDRIEDVTRIIEGQSSSRTTGESSSTDTSSGSKTAFNSLTPKLAGVDESSGSGNSSGTAAAESASTETVSTRAHGNIGVTTAAQMLEGYRDISNFSVIDFITDSFKKRFCIQVY